MRRSITSLALATIAVLVVTAGVAAADPLGWRHNGTASSVATYPDGQYGCCSADWGSSGWKGWPTTSTTPAPTAHPKATQTHRAPAVRPTTTRSTTRQLGTQTTRHGSDWCDDYGRHDDSAGYWH